MAEAGIHGPFVDAATVWLSKTAAAENFAVDYIANTDPIDDQFLSRYQLFIQLNFAPYAWKPKAVEAFTRYVDEGRGGWVGFHHAGLLGEFDGYGMWPWFWHFLGEIRFEDYIPRFATATVKITDRHHPAVEGLPPQFVIKDEEWYKWDRSPRPNVQVLGVVDEASYSPPTTVKMGGDHPVIWTNPKKRARNIYIFMGHHAELLSDVNFEMLFRNSILWTAKTR